MLVSGQYMEPEREGALFRDMYSKCRTLLTCDDHSSHIWLPGNHALSPISGEGDEERLVCLGQGIGDDGDVLAHAIVSREAAREEDMSEHTTDVVQ